MKALCPTNGATGGQEEFSLDRSRPLTFTTGADKRDGVLDTPGEKRDTIFEKVVCDLHDTRHVLDDGHFRALCHLRHGIGKTVLGDTRVRIDNEDDRSESNVTRGPGDALLLLERLRQGRLVDLSLVVFVPEMVILTGLLRDRSELVHNLFDTERERVGKVHVTSLLEPTLSQESVDIVTGPSDVRNVVVEIVRPSPVGFLLVEKL
jgi:hypothetical protein